MQNIGKRIKARRVFLGLSAEDLAPMVGISPATIYRYENGDIKKVNTAKLQPFAKALKTTEAYLMGWVDSPDAKLETSAENKAHADILYISKPSGDLAGDEIRKYLHEVIDQLSDDDLLLMKDLTLRMVRST